MATNPSNIERARRSRARAKAGVRVIPVEVSNEQVAALEAQGLIDEDRRNNRDHIAIGISWLLDALCIDAVEIDYDRLLEHTNLEEKFSATG